MIRKYEALLMFAILTVVFAGESPSLHAQHLSSAAADTISMEFMRLQRALGMHDTTVIAGVYAEQAVSLLSNQPARIGNASIARRWGRVLANPIAFTVTPEAIDVSQTGTDAFQYGKFEIHSTDSSRALIATGKVAYLWRRYADRWRIALEMDNFDSQKPNQPATNHK